MVKICVAGACGKMGRRIADLAGKDPEIKIVSLLESPDCPHVGETVEKVPGSGDSVISVISESGEAFSGVDCVIDFTLPEPTLEHLQECVKRSVGIVIGTTGFSPESELSIREASREIPIVFSPNMAVGVNIVFKVVSDICGAMGKGLRVKVDETHHVHKKDSPSGTAKKIVSCIKETCGVEPRVEVFREGEVIGEHGIVFDSEFEKIELRHSAKDRDVFAAGALRAAKFVKGKPPGLYSMADVLGI